MDEDEWGEPEPIDKPARLTMTLSVRFTAEELDAVRATAERLGVKPTAFVRQAAVDALSEPPVDRARVVQDLNRVVELVRDVQKALGPYPPTPPRRAS